MYLYLYLRALTSWLEFHVILACRSIELKLKLNSKHAQTYFTHASYSLPNFKVFNSIEHVLHISMDTKICQLQRIKFPKIKVYVCRKRTFHGSLRKMQ